MFGGTGRQIKIVKAMAGGLAVVTTLMGATPELAVDGTNALSFPRGDADASARQLTALCEDGPLFDGIRRAGRATVGSAFRLGAMVDEIEATLGNAVP